MRSSRRWLTRSSRQLTVNEVLLQPRCPGNWYSGRNQCTCRYCERVRVALSNWIGKLERVADLNNRRAPQAAIDRAIDERERASAALTAAYKAPLG